MIKRTCVIIVMICLMLAAAGCRGQHHLKDPALDISNAVITEFPESDEEYSRGIVIIDGVKFLCEDCYEPYAHTDRDTYVYAGDVVSYFINGDHYVFFCEADGLDPVEWLIRVPDDGKSNILRDEAYFIHAVGVTDIPDWLTETDEFE